MAEPSRASTPSPFSSPDRFPEFGRYGVSGMTLSLGETTPADGGTTGERKSAAERGMAERGKARELPVAGVPTISKGIENSTSTDGPGALLNAMSGGRSRVLGGVQDGVRGASALRLRLGLRWVPFSSRSTCCICCCRMGLSWLLLKLRQPSLGIACLAAGVGGSGGNCEAMSKR